eukprot:scaffold19621_cov129-Isochrysis_galbana.AAC.3
MSRDVMLPDEGDGRVLSLIRFMVDPTADGELRRSLGLDLAAGARRCYIWSESRGLQEKKKRDVFHTRVVRPAVCCRCCLLWARYYALRARIT